jgi:hypothetical protein
MPIDPRIALGVQPVQMPDFLNFASQAANIRQSQAAEQNNLALLAQRQREVQEVEALRNYMASPNFDFKNPEAINKLTQISPVLGPGIGKSLSDAETARIGAQTAARTEKSAQNAQSLRTIASFDNPLQAWASISAEERKGLDPARAGAVRQALKQAIASGPTGFRDWQIDTMRKLMSVEDQLRQDTIQVGTGATNQVLSRPTFGGRDFEKVYETEVQLTPEQKAAAARADRQFYADQRWREREFEAPSIISAAEPNLMVTKSGQVFPTVVTRPPSQPVPTTIQYQRRPDGTLSANNVDDMYDKYAPDLFKDIQRSRAALEVLGYGGQKMERIKTALRMAPSGDLATWLTNAQSSVGAETEAGKALAELRTLQANLTLERLFGKLGAGISNADVQMVQEASAAMNNPSSTAGQREAAFTTLVNYFVEKSRYPADLVAGTTPPPPMSADAMSYFNIAPAAPQLPTRNAPLFPFPR